MPLSTQFAWLFLLAIPIACVAWTVTHEEVFREAREYCRRRSEDEGSLFRGKFFYVLTCEYCFSHYVTIFFLAITGFKLLVRDFWGYVIAFFALVWVANQYMSIYNRVRLDIRHERVEIKEEEDQLKKVA